MEKKTDPVASSEARKSGRIVGKIRPKNPFDLVRLIARSQSDPRKALAELVQNSLDADAKRITITRFRDGRHACLSIRDDGRGVFPDLERREALEHVATHIGASHKLGIPVEERHRLLMLGKYGIGILGFWCVSKKLEMRTRVRGGAAVCLKLAANKEEFVIEDYLGDLGLDDTWTEVVLRDLETAAMRVMTGRRVADFLATELRGQILRRGAKIVVLDQLARGAGQKEFKVRPMRFRGTPLDVLKEIPVPGYSPIRLDLHLLSTDTKEPGRVALCCQGTIVCEDIQTVESLDFARPPWSTGLVEGIVDFAHFEVAPSTRRGVVPDAAALAFAEAMAAAEPVLMKSLEGWERVQKKEQEENLQKEIHRVFRDLPTRLPQYEFFPVKSENAKKLGSDLPEGEAIAPGLEPAPAAAEAEGEKEPDEEPELFPPGPLDSVAVSPAECELQFGAERPLRARSLDARKRRIPEGVDFAWSADTEAVKLAVDPENPSRVLVSAPERAVRATVTVEAREEDRVVRASAVVHVVAEPARKKSEESGIPPPKPVEEPYEDWRSRLYPDRWEYNTAHPDYAATAPFPRKRLRYLIALFAKEIVLRNFGEPGDERLLEKYVEVMTAIEDKLPGASGAAAGGGGH